MALSDFDLLNPLEGTRDRDLEEILRSLTLPNEPVLEVPRRQVAGAFEGVSGVQAPETRAITDSARALAEALGTAGSREFAGAGTAGGAGAGGGIPGGGPAPVDTSSGIGLLNELARRRIGQLQEEPFTATQEARRRVATFDTLERQRQQARRQVVERLAAQGHLPSSGTVETALQMVDRRFDEFRTTTERDLLLESVDIGERRQNLAVTLAQMLAQLQLQQEQMAQQERLGTRGIAATQSAGLMEGLGTLLGFILAGPAGILPGLLGGG